MPRFSVWTVINAGVCVHVFNHRYILQSEFVICIWLGYLFLCFYTKLLLEQKYTYTFMYDVEFEQESTANERDTLCMTTCASVSPHNHPPFCTTRGSHSMFHCNFNHSHSTCYVILVILREIDKMIKLSEMCSYIHFVIYWGSIRIHQQVFQNTWCQVKKGVFILKCKTVSSSCFWFWFWKYF